MPRKKRTPARVGDGGSKKRLTSKQDKEKNSKRRKSVQAKRRAPSQPRPELIVDNGDLTSTARKLRDLIAKKAELFERGPPVRIMKDGSTNTLIARPLTVEGVVHEAHRIAKPIAWKFIGGSFQKVRVTLPDRVARLYLDMVGQWKLRPLNGIAQTPILHDDGSIHFMNGYDQHTGLWCDAVQCLPMAPTIPMKTARAELRKLRYEFRTFPFAASPRVYDSKLGLHVVDLDKPPHQDESAFLAALLTAVCRPSLPLTPGMLIAAPQFSGAGTGKGLLARAICMIAFGTVPHAFTSGHETNELEKRLSSALIQATPCVFLDNANNTTLKSDTLASAITEQPAQVRQFGTLRMIALNSSTLIIVTGNGLSVSEDLARRLLRVHLDAQMENPEERPFEGGFLDRIKKRRRSLLTYILSIWRWGRQNTATLEKGIPFGSFEMWAAWVRDPLLSLGCMDPVSRIAEIKANDPRRLHMLDILTTWHSLHGEAFLKASEFDSKVRRLIDPEDSRQAIVPVLDRVAGVVINGLKLVVRRSDARWTPAKYAVRKCESAEQVQEP